MPKSVASVGETDSRKWGSVIIIGMETFSGLGKLLVILGAVLILLGLGLWGMLPFLGPLPGDVRIEREDFVFYFPLTTILVVSAIVSLSLSLLRRR